MRPVPERAAAKAAQQRTYNTGKPCRNEHLSDRWTRTGDCILCDREKALRFLRRGGSPEHPNRVAARAAGERHYSGQPCPRGHDKRFVANGQCVACSIEKCKRWNTKNPDNMAAGARRRRAADPTRHRAEVKRWKENHPEQSREMLERWKTANPERYQEIKKAGWINRRTREKNGGGKCTPDDIAFLMRKHKSRCADCGKKGKMEVDHRVPLARGGTSDRRNLQLLCRPCNRRKGAREPLEWARSNGRLL